MKTKRNKLIIFTVILIITGIFIFPSIKSIDRSSAVCSAGVYYNSHYYAFGYINWIIQRKWIGGKATFANPDPDYSTPNSLASHTIWLRTHSTISGAERPWVEAGYAKGWKTDSNVRALYWAHGYYTSNGDVKDYAEDQCKLPPGSPGTKHTYSIYYRNGNFELYIDNQWQHTYPSTYTKYIKEIDVGLESQDHANVCPKVYSTNMSYYYENQGWYSFGQANPKVHTSDSYYHFFYTNPSKDSGVDYNDYQ